MDLTKAEEGNDLIKDEVFDLPACITEATEPFKNDAKRKNISYEVIEHPGLPKYVYGDQRKVRQAVANVTANAVQHTTEGFVRVELYSAEVVDSKVRVEIVVEDSGRGMKSDELDTLFRDLEQVSTDADESQEEREAGMAKDETRTLGLGLAMVARIIRNMDGQLRLKSEDGKGSRFVIQLPFDMPPHESPGATEDLGPEASITGTSTAASVSTTLPPVDEDEVMLVDRGSTSSAYREGITPRRSYDDISIGTHPSVTSRCSVMSSKSDADRLIDAIQTPLVVGEPESEAMSAQRGSSKVAYHDTHSRGPLSRSLSPQRPFSRPGDLMRSFSTPGKGNEQEDELASSDTPVGVAFVTDTRTPIRPIKVPDEYHDMPEKPAQPSETSGVLFELGDSPQPGTTTTDGNVHKAGQPPSAKLQVLIAEDDPINMKVLRKRLEKAGHTVHHTVNGEDCAAAYREGSEQFDVVLMDMQVRTLSTVYTSPSFCPLFSSFFLFPSLLFIISYSHPPLGAHILVQPTGGTPHDRLFLAVFPIPVLIHVHAKFWVRLTSYIADANSRWPD